MSTIRHLVASTVLSLAILAGISQPAAAETRESTAVTMSEQDDFCEYAGRYLILWDDGTWGVYDVYICS
jgi:hypothetical protein